MRTSTIVIFFIAFLNFSLAGPASAGGRLAGLRPAGGPLITAPLLVDDDHIISCCASNASATADLNVTLTIYGGAVDEVLAGPQATGLTPFDTDCIDADEITSGVANCVIDVNSGSKRNVRGSLTVGDTFSFATVPAR